MGLFDLGRVVMTPGAYDFLSSEETMIIIRKHFEGDWGTLGKHSEIAGKLTQDELDRGPFATADGGKLNSIEVIKKEGNRIISEYMIRDTKIWIITYPGENTTILFPSEY